MKQLDPSVLHAMDLDVPKNILLFTVVKPPRHGSIINHSMEKSVIKRREPAPNPTVLEFTMADLTNGTSFTISQLSCFLVYLFSVLI